MSERVSELLFCLICVILHRCSFSSFLQPLCAGLYLNVVKLKLYLEDMPAQCAEKCVRVGGEERGGEEERREERKEVDDGPVVSLFFLFGLSVSGGCPPILKFSPDFRVRLKQHKKTHAQRATNAQANAQR